jgi:hypothetical protein
MSALSGITKTDCATACNANGCVIGARPRCMHPCKSGIPIELLNDRAVHAAFDEACTALGVHNIHKTGATTP